MLNILRKKLCKNILLAEKGKLRTIPFSHLIKIVEVQIKINQIQFKTNEIKLE